jgi:predicted transposase/invertase (TIGR01784 family)
MKAEQELQKASRDEEQWARALFREKNATMYKSGLYNARREGRQEGIAVGERKGREERDREVVKKSLHEGLPIDIIQKITGLRIEDIERIAGEE